jgi:para-nitrobenzyl esterase
MSTEIDAHTGFDPSNLVVETTHGRVRGDHKRGTYRFKGIPYAAPPVGPLRFAPPAPVASWAGEREAFGRFPIAPQPPDTVSRLLGAGDGPEQSETDCLTLHVWTPAPDGARRPVMVWIHGGAFVSGSGITPWYDGSNLARRDVVVVTVNYRLGALGFLHLAELGGDAFAGSGNAGLLDQAAALGWVHDNIEAFGGDPGNVTIFGESAGGMSVATQLALPASRSLFGRAIAQSGAASNVWDADHATRVATRLLEVAGIGRDQVGRLRVVPVADLLEAQNAVSAEFGITTGLPFQPGVDGDTLPEHPLAAVRSGSAAGIELLTGSNRDELLLFTAMAPGLQPTDDAGVGRRVKRFVAHDPEGLVAAYRAAYPEATAAELYNLVGTDAVFRMPAIALAEAQSSHAPTWVYEFHKASTAFGGSLGAAHAVEVPFVFDNLGAPGAKFMTGEPDEAMEHLAGQMADAWTTFARTGDPNGTSLPDWHDYSPDDRATMIFDDVPAVADDPAGTFRTAWATRR